MTPNAFSAILWLTAAASAAIAIYAWRMRRRPSAAGLALVMGCITVWTFGYGAELGVDTLDEMAFWTNVQYPGIALLPAALLIFAMQFSGRSARLARADMVLLLTLPAITLGAVWTNHLHHQFYAVTSVARCCGVALQHLEAGPIYWLFLLYSFTCAVLAAMALAHAHMSLPDRYAPQTRLLFVALAAPFLLAVLRAMGWRPLGDLDVTSLGFPVTTACMTVLVMHHRFLEVAPLARDMIVGALDHALIVLDASLCLIDANPSARRMLGLADATTPHKGRKGRLRADEILEDWPEVLEACRSDAGGQLEASFERDGTVRHYDVTVGVMRDSGGHTVGKIVLWKDITEAKAALNALHAHTRVLEAQAAASEALLLSDQPDTGIVQALEAVGVAMQVHRAYIFENHVDPATGAILTSQRYEWTAPGTVAYLDDPMLQNVPFEPDFARWYRELSEGRAIHGPVGDFPESERGFLESQGIISLVVAPIMVDRKLWGFMGLDDCATARHWSDADASSLTVLASSLGSAVLRFRAMSEVAASEQRFRRYFDLPVVGTAICGGDRRIVIANTRFGEIVGCEPQSLFGLDWTQLCSPSDVASNIGMFDRVLQDPSSIQVTETRFRRRDGVGIDVSLAIQAIESVAGSYEYMVAIQDVTRRKRAEEENRRITENLNELVMQRTLDLENANRELEAFATSVSNDLRAPLRWIEGFTRALSEECGERLGENGRHYLEQVRDAADRMSGRLDALMRLTNVAQATMNCVSMCVSDVAKEIAAELRNAEPGRNVDIRIEPGHRATACPGLLRIALKCLLHNAWKFTSTRPAAVIEFGVQEVVRADGDDASPVKAYFVRDNGVGFDPAYAHKLFGAFQRLHSESEFEGMGMGLAVAQKIIHRHGGEIWAVGAPDEGATFYFTLPVTAED